MKKIIPTSQIIAVTPAYCIDPQIAIAACRAGALGVLDLGLNSNVDAILRDVEKLETAAGNIPWGLRLDCLGSLGRLQNIAGVLTCQPHVLILAGSGQIRPAKLRKNSPESATNLFLEVNDLETAKEAEKAGFDGVIIKGSEAGGHVGAHSSFILLQELKGQLQIPYWLQGGIGLNTGGAVCMSGAAGIVLAEQLWLTREGPCAEAGDRKIWQKLDGSETTLLEGGKGNFRLFSRSGRSFLNELTAAVARGEEWLELLKKQLVETFHGDPLIPLGQDIALAGFYGDTYGTVGRVVSAFFESIEQRPHLVKKYKPLTPGSSLAREHGTDYPIVQGPMAQVSDVVPFAEEVSRAGGLPFMALGLMQAEEIRTLLAETASRLSGRSWGVGLLGFIPLAQRQKQIAVVKEFGPPFALIAGGRPGQAAELESTGIKTYLHAPSAGLLGMFVRDGATKFVLEGNEAGGHIGPRTSFILWELAIQTLLTQDIKEPELIHILFAGGIHDSFSASVVARLAAPLTACGMKVGLQMGSGYLFTREAVSTGAILPEFQAQAIKCQKTTILRSAHGHATRCARTPYCQFFNETRNGMVLAGSSQEEILENLERLNSGRLRIAAKGITRNPDRKPDTASPKYIMVQPDKRIKQGLFMLGDIASLRNKPLSIAELHAEIAAGCSDLPATARTSPSLKKRRRDSKKHDIAIVGMAALFPGAKDIRSYWENIVNRVDQIREVPERRWRVADFYDPDRFAKDKVYSKWGGFLDDIQFDSMKYGIPPASLSSVEPMQLLALEVARQAMDDAGLDHLSFPHERTAVIFGSGGIQDKAINYIFRTMLSHYLPGVDSLTTGQIEKLQEELHQKLQGWTEDSFPGVLANVTAGRVANRLNLHGSNFTVDAACASSLAALDVGINRLRSGEADMALVGAADGTNNAVSFMAFAKTHALSTQGRCRPFDDSADGIAISEGVGAMVLKRLGDAERDGDRIYAVIKGIGSSSDGRNRSLTAPHPQGQVMSIQRAYEDADIDPATVELVEAHGTGTAVGDKAEIESLCLAFGKKKGGKYQSCGVGSVKSMIGHSKVAAGMASVIKAVMAMQHKVLPPTIGVENPNTHVDFSKTPFYINSETRPWFKPMKGAPRRCGVSAFGFGGSNFHAVMEEYTSNYRVADSMDLMPRSHEIFTWKRADLTLLLETLSVFAGKLQHPATLNLSQLAASLYFDEKSHRGPDTTKMCSLAIVASSVDELLKRLVIGQRLLTEQKTDFTKVPGIYYGETVFEPGSVCFLFPGQGSQKLNMLQELVTDNVSIRPLFERADELLKGSFPQDLSRYIYPLPVFTDDERVQQESLINDTRVAQPALGVVDLAAFDLLGQYGLRPAFVAGHSYGEYVALCAAGIISRDDLIRLSEIRGRLVAQTSESRPGAMAAVRADSNTVLEAIDRLELLVVPANFNAPDQTVVAGSVEDVENAVIALNKEDIKARKIPVTAAFHTEAMQDAADPLLGELQKVTFNSGHCQVYSNTLADRYPEKASEKQKLLGRHLVKPVRFAEQVEKMYYDGARVFVEVGPGRVLSTLAGKILSGRDHVTLSMDMTGRTGWEQLAHLLSQAMTLGLPINLGNWYKGRGLDSIPVDTVIEKSKIEAIPGKHIWRINGGLVEPWNETEDSKNSFLKDKMKKNISQKNIQSLPTGSADGNSLQVLIQNNMAQFMELQRQQLDITRQFLEIQEKMLEASMGGLPVPGNSAPRVVAPQSMGPPPRMPRLNVAPSSGVATPAPASAKVADNRGAATGEAAPEQFQSDLLRAVSERTGYPEEMLDLDANLEADLGIDSIKKVEIFNALKDHHDLLEGRDEETLLEELAGMSTLGRIIDWHKNNQARAEVDTAEVSKKKVLTPAPQSATEKTSPPEDLEAASQVHRYIVRPVPAPLMQEPDELSNFPEKHLILLIGEAPAISAGLHAALSGSKYRIRQLVPGEKTRKLAGDRIEVDFSSFESVQALRDLFAKDNDTVGALFNLTGLASVVDPDSSLNFNDTSSLFLLMKVFEEDLHKSANQAGGWLVNFTCLGGRFGLQASGKIAWSTASTIGVVKSAAREWPWLRAKSIDIDADMDPHMLVAQVLSELAVEDTLVEVGFTGEGRWRLETEEADVFDLKEDGLGIDHEAVILVTGGARGITADVCHKLAEKHKPRLILVGSSKFPDAESEATKNKSRIQDLRQHFIETMQAKNGAVKPAEIEKRLKRLLQDREILHNVNRLESAGARVEYHSLDIRDEVGFGKLIEDVYAKFGRIDGVIHGAGRIDDKFIRQKPLASFISVIETKVRPAEVLASKLRPDQLKFLVFFSSVAARFGNIGQCDYSGANEVLNKLADHLNGEWPQTRVVSINWGPWASGMVSDELNKMYSEKGIKLIPVTTGVDSCLKELQIDSSGPAEVLISASVKEISEWGLGKA